jgi:hypothetical protein
MNVCTKVSKVRLVQVCDCRGRDYLFKTYMMSTKCIILVFILKCFSIRLTKYIIRRWVDEIREIWRMNVCTKVSKVHVVHFCDCRGRDYLSKTYMMSTKCIILVFILKCSSISLTKYIKYIIRRWVDEILEIWRMNVCTKVSKVRLVQVCDCRGRDYLFKTYRMSTMCIISIYFEVFFNQFEEIHYSKMSRRNT